MTDFRAHPKPSVMTRLAASILAVFFVGCDCSGVAGYRDDAGTGGGVEAAGGGTAGGMGSIGGGDTGGGSAGGSAGGGSAGGTAGGAEVDAGPPPLAAFAPARWVKTIQGGLSLWGPHVAATRDGGVVGAFTLGYAGPPIVLGAGEANQVTYTERFKGAVVWLDGNDGHLEAAQRLATDQNAPTSTAVVKPYGLVTTPGGDAVLWGTFHGYATMLPGTAAQTNYTALTQLNGNLLDRAEDPFLIRFSPDHAPRSLMRGRTPSPLTRTWFNYSLGIAPLANDEVFLVGQFDGPGFVLGDGKPGQTTLGGGMSSTYFARVDPSGNPVDVKRNGPNSTMRGLVVAGDGSRYLMTSLNLPSQLLVDTPNPVQLDPMRAPDGGSIANWTLVKLTPAGTVDWTRRFVSNTYYGSAGGLVAWDDAVAVTGIVGEGMKVTLPDGGVLAAVPATVDWKERSQGFVARLEADGGVGFMRTLDEDAVAGGGAVEGGMLKLVAQAQGAVTLDGQSALRLPAAPDGGWLTVGYTLSERGEKVGARLLGQNLQVSSLVRLAGGGFVVSGVHGDWLTDSAVGELDGGLRPMPPCLPNFDQLIFYSRIDF